MTLAELLKTANQGWPEQTLADLFDPETGAEVPNAHEIGDTLALFILQNMREMYHPKASARENLKQAVNIMEIVREDINGVISALLDALRNEEVNNA